MNYEQRAADARSIYQQGLVNVATKPMPKNQKFSPNSFVKIADDLGSSMSHFTKGVYAQIICTYAHAFSDFDENDIYSYSLLVRHDKNNWLSSSWYLEHQLTAIIDEKLIIELQKEIEEQKNK